MINFETSPAEYRRWKLKIDGADDNPMKCWLLMPARWNVSLFPY